MTTATPLDAPTVEAPPSAAPSEPAMPESTPVVGRHGPAESGDSGDSGDTGGSVVGERWRRRRERVRVRRQKEMIVGLLGLAFVATVVALASSRSPESAADAAPATTVRRTAGVPVEPLEGARVEILDGDEVTVGARRLGQRLRPAHVQLTARRRGRPASTVVRYYRPGDDLLARRVRQQVGVGTIVFVGTPPKTDSAGDEPADIIVILGEDARNE